ncbi:MAG: NAD-dependent epimerase/dehydratase family protein [Bacteroidota bacterium]
MPKTAFVTGGTGFLGLNLVKQLTEQGWKVTAMHRPSSDLRYLKRFSPNLVISSLDDEASLAAAMPKDVDAVFHVAGDTNFWRKRNPRQTQTNVDGTRHLVNAAVQQHAKCFVHTSSISAWGIMPAGEITEATPLKGKDSWLNYERTKHLGELEALKARTEGMKVVVINPGSIVGPYDQNTWARLFFALRDGKLPFAMPGDNCFVHVDQVVKAHIEAVDKGADGERYIVAGTPASLEDLTREAAQLVGVKAPGPAPVLLMKVVAHLGTAVGNLTNNEPLVTPELVNMMSRKGGIFCSDKAKAAFDLQDIPLKQCVQDNYDWLKTEGLL